MVSSGPFSSSALPPGSFLTCLFLTSSSYHWPSVTISVANSVPEATFFTTSGSLWLAIASALSAS